MRSLAFLLTLALAGCVQPRAVVETEPPQPSLAPRYPFWDEVPAPWPDAAVVRPPPSGWRLDAPAESQPLIGDASVQNLSVSRHGHSVEVQFVLFDSRSYELKVLDQPEDWSGGGKITECMRKAGAIAGVNGGFFTPQFTPMGLMITSGQKTGAWQSNKLLTGAVVVHHTPQLLWNAEVRDASHANDLLQAGPRLVDAGRAVSNLDRHKHATRTFIATDGAQRWLFGLARNVSLGELADILATPGLMPDFPVHRALNLDGGRSSALYYRTADGQEHSDPGWSTVRNYLGIVPR